MVGRSVSHPDDAWASILAAYDPSTDTVKFFKAVALPFGSGSSVLACSRAARALRMLSKFFLFVNTNFFVNGDRRPPRVSAPDCRNGDAVAGLDYFHVQVDMLGVTISFEESVSGVATISNKEGRLADEICAGNELPPFLHNFNLLMQSAELELKLGLTNWYARVPSSSNIADAASRLKWDEYPTEDFEIVSPSYDGLHVELSNLPDLWHGEKKGVRSFLQFLLRVYGFAPTSLVVLGEPFEHEVRRANLRHVVQVVVEFRQVLHRDDPEL